MKRHISWGKRDHACHRPRLIICQAEDVQTKYASALTLSYFRVYSLPILLKVVSVPSQEKCPAEDYQHLAEPSQQGWQARKSHAPGFN